MNTNDLRIKKLEQLVDRYGGRGNLASAVRTTTGYIYQLLSAKRPITEKTAQKFEKALSLKPGWFNEQPKDDHDDAPPFCLPEDDEINNLLIYYRQADNRGRKTILSIAKIEATLNVNDPLESLPNSYDGPLDGPGKPKPKRTSKKKPAKKR
jgi:hypothetical protein